MTEDKWDSAVPEHGGEGRADGSDCMDPVAAMMWRRTGWRWCRTRGHEKFWQPGNVQVKILLLGFKDRETGGFIGGS
jgi:hypothetical protein